MINKTPKDFLFVFEVKKKLKSSNENNISQELNSSGLQESTNDNTNNKPSQNIKKNESENENIPSVDNEVRQDGKMAKENSFSRAKIMTENKIILQASKMHQNDINPVKSKQFENLQNKIQKYKDDIKMLNDDKIEKIKVKNDEIQNLKKTNEEENDKYIKEIESQKLILKEKNNEKQGLELELQILTTNLLAEKEKHKSSRVEFIFPAMFH